MREQMLARFRIDGILRVAAVLPPASSEMVISRLKVLAQLNIAEHRRPQEGHLSIPHPSEPSLAIDLRVSILPTLFGESAVIRILNRKDLIFDDIAKLGMNPEDLARFEDAIHRPYGMILVTGPVGSGKTTTLYTALNAIRSLERNIVTLEDPVEYQLENV
jgi:type II secretory ATPase GspE/PulE/Tfp pilus assembly ATPase PilB-like protein